MGLTAVIAFLATAILGRILIPLLQKFKFGQTVRDNGPQTHLVKMGIPTMGGFMFLIPIIILLLVFSRLSIDSIVISATVLLYALVGFLDDFLKIKRKSKDGLTVLQKSVGLIAVSALFSLYFVYFSKIGTDIILPFSQMGQTFAIPKLLYVFILIITLYLTTNAVNLTDGVDGLSSSVTILVLILFLFVAYAHTDNQIISTLCLATIGGLMAFLLYNAYPAKVFMGDTGSMTLGAIVTISAIYLKIPWIILIAGIIYVTEAVSVVIQVGHFKRTKKRVFKMAPIHHHFELSGWKEIKVVVVFTLITLVACVLSYAILIWI